MPRPWFARSISSTSGPVTLGDRLTVAIDVGHLGRTSCPLKYDLAVGGERATSVRTTPVRLDSEGIPEPLPDSWRERLEPYHNEV
jgi:acyl-CoA thioesterase FadM